MASRPLLQIKERGFVQANDIDTKLLPRIPDGVEWQIEWILFSDQNIGDNKSGGFLVEWGSAGDWEIVHTGFLTGSISRLALRQAFRGDGTKRLRILRQNNSDVRKRMVVIIAGFKRD